MGNSAPTNYLICDGTVYNISSYTKLADYFNTQFGKKNYFGGNGTTTFAVPNLKGEFLRGTGTNSNANQGSGANVGVHQNGTRSNYIGVGVYALYAENNDTGILDYDSLIHNSTGYNSYDKTSTSTSGGGTWSGCSYISRPTNTSVLYCICYK